MRIHRVLPLFVGLAVSACDDFDGPSQDGRLVVSTATGGEDPDQDGYLLLVDDVETLALSPSATAEVEVRAGAHSLRLLGVAKHCSVVPGRSLEVDVEPGSTTPVGFTIDCPATGARITTITTGLDIDPNGYRITVSTVDWSGIVANGTALIHLEPGERTIAVVDLAPNCAIEGPQSRTVIIVDNEVVPLEFAAVCTATSGVISVGVEAVGIDMEGEYLATVDGTSYPVELSHPTYLTDVTPGVHVVALNPPANCSVQTDPQSIGVTAGGMVRDTAEVSFSVSCVSRLGTLRISASTTGIPPADDYNVWVCVPDWYFGCYSYPASPLGALDPNGTLVAQVQPGTYHIWLEDVPGTCSILETPNSFTIGPRDTLELEFSVSCS